MAVMTILMQCHRRDDGGTANCDNNDGALVMWLQKKIQCGFMKGLIGDLRRRLPHYFSDYKDGERLLQGH